MTTQAQPSDTTATPSSAATSAATSSKLHGTFEQRLAAVNASLASDESPGETTDDAERVAETSADDPKKKPEDKPEPSAAPLDDAAKRAADRRDRLAAAVAKTREQVDRKAHLAERDKMGRKLAELEARAQAAETAAKAAQDAAAARIDPEQLDEAGLFALAEKMKVTPQKLGEWIQMATTSPEKVAEAAAIKRQRAEVDPKIAALETQIANLVARAEAAEKQHEAATQASAAKAAEEQQTSAFLGMVAKATDRAPLAAKLLSADRHEFMQMAEIAAERVPGMGAEALLDALEDLLDTDGRAHAQKVAELYGFAPATTTTTASHAPATKPNTTRGPAKPNTVSNSLAQQRASVLEEEDFARLPFHERVARLNHD